MIDISFDIVEVGGIRAGTHKGCPYGSDNLAIFIYSAQFHGAVGAPLVGARLGLEI